MATRLSVNLNKIALLRNSRGSDNPDPLYFAKLALDNGAGGITLHPRPDGRHARPEDLYKIYDLIQKYPGAEFNIEGNPKSLTFGKKEHLLETVLEIAPHQFTMVPDTDGQLTSDHGWDLTMETDYLSGIIPKFNNRGVRVSLFVDPEFDKWELLKKTGATSIEMYTKSYVDNFIAGAPESILPVFVKLADEGKERGVQINAGHDLSLENLGLFIESVPGVCEVSIGHALTSESLIHGFEKVIREYKKILEQNS